MAVVGCVVAFGPCLAAQHQYGRYQVWKSIYDAYNSPSAGNLYRAGLNTSRHAYDTLVTGSKFIHPYIRNTFQVINAAVVEIGNRIPIE